MVRLGIPHYIRKKDARSMVPFSDFVILNVYLVIFAILLLIHSALGIGVDTGDGDCVD